MPYRDKEKQRAFQRDWQRKRKATIKGAGSNESITLNLLPEMKIKTASDILAILEQQINEVRAVEVDKLSKARCIAYLCAVALRACETAEIEKRLTLLEEAILQKGNKSCPQILKTG